MTFEDTNVGDLVSLTVISGEKHLNFESKIINVIDKCLVIEPIIMNKVILSFPKNLAVEMMVVHPDATPIYWKRVDVDIKVYHEKNCHVITSKLPGVKLNRRNNFRVFIGANVKITAGTKEPVNVLLKDISSTGFAIIVDSKIEIELHKKITVEYTDHSFQKFFELSGRPIRTCEVDNSSRLYGCILDRRNPDLENYLSQKQMENRPNRNKK